MRPFISGISRRPSGGQLGNGGTSGLPPRLAPGNGNPGRYSPMAQPTLPASRQNSASSTARPTPSATLAAGLADLGGDSQPAQRLQSAGSSQGKGSQPVHVKVIVRCRPLAEHEGNDSDVVECREECKEVVVKHFRRSEVYDKTFTFDGVCGPQISQSKLFTTYVVPMVDEVLQGFNCTIFAYGQTGTGKTFTMEGEWTKEMTSEPPTPVGGRGRTAVPGVHLPRGVGVIPRAISLIFDRLCSGGLEYSVKVSYLEIYNEELCDLLAGECAEKQMLRIFDNNSLLSGASHQSTKGLAVDKLEEITVRSLQEVYTILSQAVRKRRTAETLMNRQSSRSHSIFTVTITTKETSLEGEDIIRIGKLNLVDLAGSENIQRSGTCHLKDRTKEAGMINQSLLTLGRVINALVEHSQYIPYRDSKLTRLLQDSLGGRTKTCIIATISPCITSLEETLSTLDYAHRAKHIRNRPEINQRMTQKFVLKELTAEIERLKQELAWAREKSGAVYLSTERYDAMESQLAEQSAGIKDLRFVAAQYQTEIGQLKSIIDDQGAELADLRESEAAAKQQVANTTDKLERATGLLTHSMKVSCETSMYAAFKMLETGVFASSANGYARLIRVAHQILQVLLSRLITVATNFDQVAARQANLIEAGVVEKARSADSQAEFVGDVVTKFGVEFRAVVDGYTGQLGETADALDTRLHDILGDALEARIRDDLVRKLQQFLASFDAVDAAIASREDSRWESFFDEVVDRTLVSRMDESKSQVAQHLRTLSAANLEYAKALQDTLDDLNDSCKHHRDLEIDQLSFMVRILVQQLQATKAELATAKKRVAEVQQEAENHLQAMQQEMGSLISEFSAKFLKLTELAAQSSARYLTSMANECAHVQQATSESADKMHAAMEGLVSKRESASGEMGGKVAAVTEAILRHRNKLGNVTGSAIEGMDSHVGGVAEIQKCLRDAIQQRQQETSDAWVELVAERGKLATAAGAEIEQGLQSIAMDWQGEQKVLRAQLQNDVKAVAAELAETVRNRLSSQQPQIDAAVEQQREQIGAMAQAAKDVEAAASEFNKMHIESQLPKWERLAQLFRQAPRCEEYIAVAPAALREVIDSVDFDHKLNMAREVSPRSAFAVLASHEAAVGDSQGGKVHPGTAKAVGRLLQAVKALRPVAAIPRPSSGSGKSSAPETPATFSIKHSTGSSFSAEQPRGHLRQLYNSAQPASATASPRRPTPRAPALPSSQQENWPPSAVSRLEQEQLGPLGLALLMGGGEFEVNACGTRIINAAAGLISERRQAVGQHPSGTGGLGGTDSPQSAPQAFDVEHSATRAIYDQYLEAVSLLARDT